MSKIAEKLDAMRGGGHHVPVGLDEILTDIDERLTALEGSKKAEPAKKWSKEELNPLDGERSDG